MKSDTSSMSRTQIVTHYDTGQVSNFGILSVDDSLTQQIDLYTKLFMLNCISNPTFLFIWLNQ